MRDNGCPARAELAAFSRGKLGDDAAARVAEHVETCAGCVAELNVLADQPDSFIAHLRELAECDQYAADAEFRAALARLLPGAARRGGPEESSVAAGDARSTSDGADLTGRCLRDYRLLEKLGEGGMGSVYRAVHSRLERIVAVKTLELRKSVHALARFEREMKVVGRLDHPSVVKAHDAGEADGIYFLVMEYVDGIDLARLSARVGPMRIADACEIVRQAAEAIDYVARFGMVHRDIKPSNLMLTREGKVKLLDLGLALLKSDLGPDDELTQTGQIMGTIDYMAPEQLDDSHTVDSRNDIYGLGCTLYKLLAGHPPFGQQREKRVLKKLLAQASQPVPDIRQFRPDVDEMLWDVLRKMLAQSVDERYASPAEVVAALEPFIAGADLVALMHTRDAAGQDAVKSRETDVGKDGAVSTSRERHVSLTGAAGSENGRAGSEASTGADGSKEVARVRGSRIGSSAKPASRRWVVLGTLIVAAVVLPLGTAWWTGAGNWLRPRDASPPESASNVPRTAVGSSRVSSESGAANSASRNTTEQEVDEGAEPSALERAGVELEPIELTQTGAVWPLANVSHPPTLPGVLSWTIETRNHRGSVYSLAVDPDGRWVATGGMDAIIRVWNPDSAELVRALAGHVAPVNRLAASPDGTMLAAASTDGLLRIWLVDTGRVVRSYPQRAQIDDLCWSPEDHTVAYCSDGDLFVWEVLAQPEPRPVASLPEKRITRVAWRPVPKPQRSNPEARNCVAIAVANEVQLLNLRTGAVTQTVARHSSEVTALAWERFGYYLASAARGPTAQVWFYTMDSASSPTIIDVDRIVDSVESLAWSRNIDYLAAACQSRPIGGAVTHGYVYAWSRENPESHWLANRPGGAATQVGWLPDSDRLVSVGVDGCTFIWSRQRGGVVHQIEPVKVDTMGGGAALSPDGTKLAISTESKPGIVFDLRNGELLPWRFERVPAAWSSNSQWLASATAYPYQLIVRDVAGQTLCTRDFLDGVDCVSWSPAGSELAIGNGPRLVIFDPMRGTEDPIAIRPTRSVVDAIAWSSDGSLLAMKERDSDCTVRILDVASGDWNGELRVTSQVSAFGWKPKDRILAIATSDGIEFWDARKHRPADSLSALPYGQVDALSWSADGELLATAARTSQNLIVRDVRRGRELWAIHPRTLPTTGVWWSSNAEDAGHPLRIDPAPLTTHMWWSPEGSLIMTAGHRSFVGFYDAETGNAAGAIAVLGQEPDRLSYVSIGCNGHYRAPEGAEAELVYIVQTQEGQETFTPWQFAEKYGWANDPDSLVFPGVSGSER